MADERVKEKEGEIKRGGCITCYSICYTELIVYCDWMRHLSKAVKLPMNYPFLSLALSVHLALALYLPLSPFGTQPVCMTLSLFLCLFPRCHMYLSQSTISNMGCAGEE